MPGLLAALHDRIYQKAKERMDACIYDVDSWQEFAETMEKKPGFIRAAWCGSPGCEVKVKEETTATSRCIAEAGLAEDALCVVCGKAARHLVFWGKAY